MKEIIPLALVALPSLFAFPIILLGIWEVIPLRLGAMMLVFPVALSAFLYVFSLHEPWYVALGLFFVVLGALELILFISHRGVSELVKPSSQFDLISDIKLKR